MSDALHFHYDFIPCEILDPATSAHRIAMMRAAGVQTVWLTVYAYGNALATAQEITDAKCLLERHGFFVQALSVVKRHFDFNFHVLSLLDKGSPAHLGRGFPCLIMRVL